MSQKYDAPAGAPPQYNNPGISSPAPAHTSPYNQPAPYQSDGYPPNVGQSPQPGYQQGYQQPGYGPPQGEFYGQQQQYPQQGHPQQGYGYPQQGYQQQGGPQYGNQQGQFVDQDRGNKGAATGIFAACAGLMACCCCLDCLF